MWSQIVADECWNAFGLIVFLSQCNRSRPEPRGARGGHDVIANSKGCARLRVTQVSAQPFMFGAGKTNEILLTIPA